MADDSRDYKVGLKRHKPTGQKDSETGADTLLQ